MADLPRSLPEALQHLCRWMDAADPIIHAAIVANGHAHIQDSDMQDDLRSLALWMVANPGATVADADAFFMGLSISRE